MIINVRGTSGSGKSTLVRAIMASYESKSPVFVGGRKRPIGYELRCSGRAPLFVPGHYETACGGCDTIAEKQFDTVYQLVRAAATQGFNVLFEGLLITAEAARLIKLHEDGLSVAVVMLDTPLEECRRSVLARRAEKGNDDPPGENFDKNLASKDKAARTTMRRFLAAGIPCHTASRQQASELVKHLLGMS